MSLPTPQEGVMQEIGGIQIFEDKNMRDGTYIALDKDGLPIKGKDIRLTPISKIVVKSIESFKIAIENNGGKLMTPNQEPVERDWDDCTREKEWWEEPLEKYAEERGESELHEEHCEVNSEWQDDCTCGMFGLKDLFYTTLSHQIALSRAEVLEEVRKGVEVKIGQCKQPITQSCEYCSALHDIKTIIGEL